MGGAKNCPETPRQKMIGMMYLVLTAMLALNVSTDVLKAFKLVDDSLHTTLATTDSRNKLMMNDFLRARNDNPEKNGVWYDEAVNLTNRSDSLFNYIQDFKYKIAVETDGAKQADTLAREIKGNDNRDATTRYALPESSDKPALVLKNMLVEYREYLISLDSARAEEFNTTFNLDDRLDHEGKMVTWEDQMFLDMPSGAAVTLLTKLQNDVRNAQCEMIQYLMSRGDEGDLRVNKFYALVVPESKNVFRGGQYKARIIMAAVDSTQTPEYYVDGQRINDEGEYIVPATSLGAKNFAGMITFVHPKTGEMIELPFEDSYSVSEPMVSISNVDLNVMYRGYDNKFSISVPGIANDKIRVSVNGATAHQQGGYWIVKPGANANKVTISVSADMDGHMQSMGSQEFSVKPLPKPAGFFKSGDKQYADGSIPRNALKDPNGMVVASYGPGEVLNVPFTVTGFKANINGTVTESNGNKFSKDQLNRINKLKKGATVIIMDIRAQSKGGERVPVSSLPLILN